MKLTALPESHGRKHSDWLNFMQSRLLLARQLLRDDGVIFISIDDNEVHNLRKLMDQIFGEENFVANVVWQKKYAPTNDAKGFSNIHDHIIIYQKSEGFERNLLPRTSEINKPYKNNDNDGRGLWRSGDLLVKSYSKSGIYEVKNPKTNEIFFPQKGSSWRYSNDTMQQLLQENCIYFGKDGCGAPQLKRYLSEVQQGIVPGTWWGWKEVDHNDGASKELRALFNGKSFDTPKPVKLIKQIVTLSTKSINDIFLDFFAGSGTSAHALMQKNAEDGGNRKHIMVQIPEFTDEKSEAYKAGYKTISDITIERVKRAGAKIREENPDTKIDTGFRVFTLSQSNFPENLFTPDADKSDAENIQALEAHLAQSAQLRLFETDELSNLVTEISLKNGFGLFYQLETMDDFERNALYRLHGNGKSALLCLDNNLHDDTVEKLKPFKDEQLILSKFALDTSKKFSLHTEFKDNLWVV